MAAENAWKHTCDTHNDARYAAKEIGILGQRYPEVWNKIQHLKFPGRGQRDTPVGDYAFS